MENKLLNTIKFLNEIEKLKSITRHSWTTSGRQESVPEHTWRMCVIAFILEKDFPDINMQKVMEMSLIHDFGEIYVGDTPNFDESRPLLQKDEQEDVKKVVSSLDKELQEKITSLWNEFHENKTQEAKLANAFDKMEAILQHNESDFSTWTKHEWELNKVYGEKYTNFHPLTKKFREILKQQTIKKIENEKTNP
tara:strand:+ start:804 stop:1385 length:582 start_codon:yes stop_codon:yes gene_type:complete